ncbi:hypothetical protein ACS5PK_02885 [Roseateles sp. DB2]|uniref:hypothetical protein n=1 Tax=Roseateles sp. DB2 TaxID=3453717 RepID=UPI003EE87A8C
MPLPQGSGPGAAAAQASEDELPEGLDEGCQQRPALHEQLAMVDIFRVVYREQLKATPAPAQAPAVCGTGRGD